MRITAIEIYQVDLPLHEGSYRWSGGKSVSVFDSTVVRIETDAGLVGYGESCPLGPAYLPSYAGGVRAGLAELAPHLIGADPTQLGPLNHLMDSQLMGHPYVKSPIDIACWDILGQATAIAHLAHSTPEAFRFTSTDFNSYVTVSLAQGAPQRVDGRMSASTAPGLGLTPRLDVLGTPVLTVGRPAQE